MKKLLLTSAIASALAVSTTAANAVDIYSITLGDIDGDGAVSGFRFTTPATAYAAADNSFPTGVPATFPGDLTFGGANDDCITTGQGGTNPGSCGSLLAGGEVGTDVFTSGFNFGGGGQFAPIIVGSTFSTTTDEYSVATGTGSVAGSISGSGAGSALDLTSLDFGGVYGATFILAPQSKADFKRINGATPTAADESAPVLSDPAFTGASTTGLDYYIDQLVDNGDGTWGFVIRWTAKIAQGTPFDGNIARWRLEGTFDTNAPAIPVPAAAWLFGSGLLGLVGVARRKKSA